MQSTDLTTRMKAVLSVLYRSSQSPSFLFSISESTSCRLSCLDWSSRKVWKNRQCSMDGASMNTVRAYAGAGEGVVAGGATGAGAGAGAMGVTVAERDTVEAVVCTR